MELHVYNRIVYIVKKGINTFSKKGVFKGGHNFFPGGRGTTCTFIHKVPFKSKLNLEKHKFEKR